MKQSIQRGIRAVVASLALSAMFIPTALPIVAQSAVAAEYKVVFKFKKNGFRSIRMLGRSPYICTPSGFGQKGRCYLRGSA